MTNVVKRQGGDPFQGWVQFAVVRSGAGVGQCRYTCTCGEQQMNATRAIGYELARAHVAQHGVVIEVSTGPTARRVAGSWSSGVPLDQVEEARAWQLGARPEPTCSHAT
jgi:hypothetical protein